MISLLDELSQLEIDCGFNRKSCLCSRSAASPGVNMCDMGGGVENNSGMGSICILLYVPQFPK